MGDGFYSYSSVCAIWKLWPARSTHLHAEHEWWRGQMPSYPLWRHVLIPDSCPLVPGALLPQNWSSPSPTPSSHAKCSGRETCITYYTQCACWQARYYPVDLVEWVTYLTCLSRINLHWKNFLISSGIHIEVKHFFCKSNLIAVQSQTTYACWCHMNLLSLSTGYHHHIVSIFVIQLLPSHFDEANMFKATRIWCCESQETASSFVYKAFQGLVCQLVRR